jgi:hypothetical protein
MVHNPKHKVHSFRGLLGDGGQDEINLERQNVNLAYRIVKFEVMPSQPFTVNSESVVKIYRESSTPDETIDFSQPDLLGAAVLNNSDSYNYNPPPSIIFDNTLFSRNIYVTNANGGGTGSEAVNYYIEIEEVPVGAATLMQLKLGVARKLIGAKMGG